MPILFFALFVMGARAVALGEMQEIGHTYNQAQTLQWIDSQRFAVGRWDGSITIFRRPLCPLETGPVIVQALVPPSSREIGMMTLLPSQWLVTSNASDSLALWKPGRNQFRLARIVKYDTSAGSFNSGCLTQSGDSVGYVSGHANGRIIRWRFNRGGRMTPEMTIDVRSPDPVPSPFPLKNVRGIVHWRNGIVITGAEDGDLCMVNMSTGQILHRQRYNPTAQRGINGLALLGDLLLVSNCTVGTSEPNLWLYRITDSGMELLDSRYIATAPDIPDVYGMDVALVSIGDEVQFYASTGEGMLWHGKIEDNRLKPMDSVVTGKFGVAPVFDLLPDAALLASADHDIRVFQPGQGGNGCIRRIAVIHMVPVLGDVEANHRIIEEAIQKAADAGANWILMPELAETGYKFIYTIGTDWIEEFPSAWLKKLSDIALQRRISLFVGFPERAAGSGKLHNSVAVIDQTGKIHGTYSKIKVLKTPGEGWAEPGREKPIFTIDGIRIGILICADAYPQEIARQYARAKADILLSSASWAPGSMGPNGCWEDRSRETGLPLIVCNRSGVEPDLSFVESESVVDLYGKRLFTFQSPETKVFLVDWNKRCEVFTLVGSILIDVQN